MPHARRQPAKREGTGDNPITDCVGSFTFYIPVPGNVARRNETLSHGKPTINSTVLKQALFSVKTSLVYTQKKPCLHSKEALFENEGDVASKLPNKNPRKWQRINLCETAFNKNRAGTIPVPCPIFVYSCFCFLQRQKAPFHSNSTTWLRKPIYGVNT